LAERKPEQFGEDEADANPVTATDSLTDADKKRSGVNHMERSIGLTKNLKLPTLATLLVISGNVIGQQQPPSVSHPSASSAQATPRKPGSPYGSAVGTATNMKPASGAITGFVYWDMSGIKTPSSCQGLGAQVSTVTVSKGSPQVLATASTFTQMGPQTDMSAPGAPKYMLCSYSFNKLPENLYLKVTVSAPSSEFSPATTSASPFQIQGGNCNQTPQSTLSFILSGGEMLCGDNAYNVNLKLQALSMASRPTGVTGPLINRPAATLLSAKPEAAGNMTSADGGLLSPARAGRDGNFAHSIGGSGGYEGTTRATAKGPGPQGISSVNGEGRGGFTGGIKPGGSGGFTGGVMPTLQTEPSPVMTSTVSGAYVPRMPPMTSNAKRDASPAADAATRAQIKSKLQLQLVAATPRMAQPVSSALKPVNPNTPEVQALQRQKIFVTSLRTQPAPGKGALVPSNVGGVVMQNQSATNPLLHAPVPTKICPAPQIHSVNSKNAGVVFTQDPLYNDYVITGCGFGSLEGQVYLSGAITGGRINLLVKPNQWSDTKIEAIVQPGLTGVLDGWPDLIVVSSGGTPAKFPNCRFYAQRQSVLLPTIPQQYVTLANVTVGDATHGFGTEYCSGPDVSHLFPCIAFNAGPPLDGITNGHDHRNDPNEMVSNAVDRDGGQLQFNAGEDVYDLSSMAPGFEVDYPTVYWYAWTSDVCEGWASDAFPKKPGDSVGYDTEGHYSWYKKTKTKVVVDWGVDHCAWRWLGIFKVDDWYNSGYSLQVHVNGPIGVDPWTGHPVSSATNIGQRQPNRVVQLP
jgi:hypothetical protein